MYVCVYAMHEHMHVCMNVMHECMQCAMCPEITTITFSVDSITVVILIVQI